MDDNEKKDYKPRTNGIDFEGMFDANAPLFSGGNDDINTDQLESIAQDEQEHLRKLELEQFERNKAAIASKKGGSKRRPTTGGRSGMSFRDPLIEAERKNKKAEYEVQSFDTKLKKAELDKMRVETELERERSIRAARQQAEIDSMGNGPRTKQQQTQINPEALMSILQASKKPDGSVDPMTFSTLTGSLTGQGGAPDMSNILLMQLLGGGNQQQQKPAGGGMDSMLMMLILEMIKQMNAMSQSNARQMTEMFKSQGGGGGGGQQQGNTMSLAMQMAQNNSQQQQGLFQLLLERMKDENSELRHALGNQDPLGEIARTAGALKNLGVFGQQMSPESQIAMKKLDHSQEMDKLRAGNESEAQANFANAFTSLGKEAMQTEWLGDLLSSLGSMAGTVAQDKIDQRQHQQHFDPIPQDAVHPQDFQYSQPAPAHQQQYAPQPAPAPAPGDEQWGSEENNQFNELLSELQQRIQEQGMAPPQQPQPQPQTQQPSFGSQESINLEENDHSQHSYEPETDEQGYEILDLGKIMSPDFGKREKDNV